MRPDLDAAAAAETEGDARTALVPGRPPHSSTAEPGKGSRGAAPERAAGFIFALVSALGFSALGILARVVYAEGLEPFQALAWRFLVAGTSLWVWVLITGRARGLGGRRLGKLVLLGFGFALQAGLFFFAVEAVGPAAASLLLYLYPGFVLVIAAFAFRRRPTLAQIASFALSLAGCALAFLRPGAWPAGGVALGLVVALTYAAYLAAGEKALRGEDPIVATAVLMAVAAATFTTLSLASGGLPLPSPKAALGLVGIAFVATLLPITTLFASIRRIGASDASLVSTAELPATLLLAALALGETLDARALAGAALVTAGVVLIHVAERRAPPEA
ncbi:MAG: DMT family transporter [Spirochaetia bacterium]|nr:DMT family transporter [Spirochaetia bacterium]